MCGGKPGRRHFDPELTSPRQSLRCLGCLQWPPTLTGFSRAVHKQQVLQCLAVNARSALLLTTSLSEQSAHDTTIDSTVVGYTRITNLQLVGTNHTSEPQTSMYNNVRDSVCREYSRCHSPSPSTSSALKVALALAMMWGSISSG